MLCLAAMEVPCVQERERPWLPMCRAASVSPDVERQAMLQHCLPASCFAKDGCGFLKVQAVAQDAFKLHFKSLVWV